MSIFYFRKGFLPFFVCYIAFHVETQLLAGNSPSVGFLENKGQMTDVTGSPVKDVLFRCSTPGLDLYVRESGLTYVFTRHDEKEGNEATGERKIHSFSYETVQLNLLGASIKKEHIIREEPTASSNHYYLGHCPDGIKDVKQYARIVFRNVYPGIDWILYNSDEKGFKYDFVVNPGADASNIKLEYVSLYKPVLKNDGGILISTPLGKLNENAPFSYLQENRLAIKTRFDFISEKKDNKVYKTIFGFSLSGKGNYSQPLVIDPQLTWSTFFGGSNIEGTRTIETDTAGNVFVAGYTISSNLPLFNSGGYYQGSVAALSYQFIAKFSPGGVLLWSTFYSGSGTGTQTDVAALDLDAAGNVFLCGITTTTNFPVLTNNTYFQGTNAGVTDSYLIKFTNSGTRLWATYFGGNSVDNAMGLSVDQAGNVFMVGNTQSTNLPLFNAGGYYQATSTLTTPGFMTKFSNNGTLLWSTLYDGVQPFAADVNANGDLYVTGTGNTGAMVLLNPGGGAYFQGTGASVETAVIRFTNSTTLLWSTYFGGSGIDLGRSIVCDKFGNVFIAGVTTSTSFPLQNSGGFFQSSIGNINLTTGDAFIAKFSPAGSLLWSTYYGGNDLENFTTYDNLDVDTCGNVYLAFETRSSNMFTKAACEGGYRDSVLDVASTNSIGDIFVARFKNNSILEWATYIGGNGIDIRSPLTVDKNQQLYLTGEWILGSQTNNYPTVSGGTGSYLSASSAGIDDVFFNRFSAIPSVPSFSYAGSLCANSPSATVAGAVFPAGTFSATPGLSINPATGVITPSATAPGNYSVTFSYTISACACGMPTTGLSGAVSTTVTILPVPVLTVTGNSSVCAGSAATLLATGASSFGWSTGPITASVSLAPAVTAVYTVTGISSTGCSAKQNVTVTVLPNPTLYVTGNTAICQGQSLTLVGNGASTYSWSGGPSTSNYVVSPLSSTVYALSGTSGGCTNTLSVPVTVLSLPIVSVTGGGTLCAGQSTMLVASGAATYSWSNSAITQSLIVTPTSSTVYAVTGTGNNGCSMTAVVQVLVSNCVGLEDYFQKAGLKVFPNPNKGTFRAVAESPLDLLLTNSLGQQVRDIRLDKDNNYEIEISELSKGVYFLKPIEFQDQVGLKIVVE